MYVRQENAKLTSLTNILHFTHTLSVTPALITMADSCSMLSSETEKYAHVTFFFNGGQEKPFDQEDRQLVPSPKVATYDLQPEMSADGVGKAVSMMYTKCNGDYRILVNTWFCVSLFCNL